MGHVPTHIEDILKVNAHPKFYVQWIDHLDEIYAKIEQWIEKAGLTSDREEMEKIAAWIVPYLCSDPGERPKISDMDSKHVREAWKEILDDLESMHRNKTLYGWLGVGQSELEHKIAIARKQYRHPIPRRGSHRKILDQGLDFLFWRMEEIGKDAAEQEFAVLELFKTFCFDGFPEMSTAKAFGIVDRIRKEALKQPRVEFDPTTKAE
ncbi:MAG: hypothetical protein JSU61_06725 [Fidelibacterota bacterium]|nr:MAG: hypothetical protein JSU61_06725 [Candidatus Neomarinimicrobiota bacterium]